MAAIRRATSSGPPLPAALVAQRGTLIALGAVGLSLGAAWAWQCSKRAMTSIETPSPEGIPKKKVPSQRKHRTKRQKSRAQSSGEVAVHESSEEDLPVTPDERPAEGAHAAAGRDADEPAGVDATEATNAAQPADVEVVDAIARASSPDADETTDASGVVDSTVLAADAADSLTGAGSSEGLSLEVSGETAGEGQWIAVERRKGRGRKAGAAAGVAADGLTGESQVPEDTEDAQADSKPSVAALKVRTASFWG